MFSAVMVFTSQVLQGQAQAQARPKPITAYEVHEACRHPAAFPTESFANRTAGQGRRWGNADGISVGEPDAKLSLLCSGVNLQVPGMSWRQASRRWANAVSKDSFPSAEAIRWYAEEAESALYQWVTNTSKPEEAEELRRLAIPAVPFETGTARIAESDSALVRRISEMLRDHLVRNPQDTVTVQGQADPRGNPMQNVTLASERAAQLLAAIMRYDDGTLAENLGRIRTSGRVVTTESIEAAVARVVDNSRTRGVVASQARAGAETGELLKARSGGFYAESPTSVSGTRLLGPDAAQSSSISNASPSHRSGSLTLALVDVVGEQAAEQVQMFLVEEVTRGICGRSTAQITPTIRIYRDMLPSTCALFGNISNQRVPRPTIASLRASVRSDITGMFPVLLAEALGNQFGGGETDARAEAVFAVALIQYIVSVAQGEDALEAAARVPERFAVVITDSPTKAKVLDTDVASALRQVAPFLRLYREARASIRGGEDAKALRDQVLILSLRALLVNASDPEVREQLWGVGGQPNVDQVLRTVPALVDAATRLENAYDGVRQAVGASPEQRLQLVGNVLAGSTDLFLSLLPESISAQRLGRYRVLLSPIQDLAMSLASRDFRGALMHGLVLAANVSPQNSTCLLPSGLVCPNVDAFKAEHLRLASFASDFANAQDQSGMNEALRNFVSEGGGYRGKRQGNRRSFFTVNAYLGLAGAREWGYERGAEANYQGAFYLPVGVEWVHRWGLRRAAFPSTSIFLQVIDLGSIAAARYKDDRDVEQPNPELMDILSPGVFLVLPVARSPFSLGGGVSVAPRAQVVGETVSGNEKISGALRVSIFAAVDVPLFP